MSTLEKQAPAFIDELLPQEHLFFTLQNLEREIDSKVVQKQLQIADASFKTSKVKRTLKLFVSNTVEDIQQVEGGEPVPSWALRIEGKLETYGRHGRLANRKLSHYFQSVCVEFEQNQNDKQFVEWRNSPSCPESDGFEVRRVGVPFSKHFTIVLTLSNQPERLKLSPDMAAVLQIQAGTRPEIVMAIWQYIKLHNLQESDEKKQVLNDKALANLFGCPKMTFSEIPNVIQPHLLPIDPITIEYDIDMEHGGLLVHDIEVDLEDPSKTRPPVSLSIAALQRELGLLDQRISECVMAMKTAQASTKILDSFCQDPVGCVNSLLARQTADYETVVDEVPISREDLNKASVYEGEDIDQAIASLLQSMRLQF